jgi:hypothetical protein
MGTRPLGNPERPIPRAGFGAWVIGGSGEEYARGALRASNQPLITPSGTRRATLRARPASWTTPTTRSTSL